MKFHPAFCVLAVAAVLSGCAVAQTTPPRPRPLGEIARVERGEIVNVTDTQIDLRTGAGGRTMRASTPHIPMGPIAVAVPVRIGGEKKVEVPGEEITVKLANGTMIQLVQERSDPPLAPGERVRVLYERTENPNAKPRIRVERE